MIRYILSITFFISATISFAQVQLSVDKIMQDPSKWIGTSPNKISWNASSDKVYFNWNPDQEPLDETFQYSIKEKNKRPLNVNEEKSLIPSGVTNHNKTLKLYTKNQGLWLQVLKTGKTEQLFSLIGGISSPYFINDNLIGFYKDKSIYTFDIENKLLFHFATFENSPTQKGSKNDHNDFLSRQQKELFQVLNDREKKQALRKEKKNELSSKYPIVISIPKGSVRSPQMNANRTYIAYTSYESASGNTETLVPHFVTETGYVQTKDARVKVGSEQASSKLFIYGIDSGKVIAPQLEQLPNIKMQPAYFTDYPDRFITNPNELNDRKVNVTNFLWSNNGEQLVANILSDDNKDRWIVLVNPTNGDLTTIDHQHDDAWIGGPGIGGWSFWGGELGWMSDDQSIWFQSEASGYSHLYKCNTSTLKKTQLTSGNFEVYEPQLSKDGKDFYFTANIENPGIRHFYKLPVKGGAPIQLTSMEGNNEVTLSPDEKNLAIRFSTANQPWELYLQANKAGAKASKITKSTTSEFDSYNWRMPQFINFEASDKAQVPARLYKPEKANGAAVIFVHGAGYLQNAHRWWSSYFREYQFHNLLCDLGYTVLDIDYRGSAGYGRDWRTAIYRHMGGKDLSDQVDGAKYLIENQNIDANRIGIYGGSYGGFITLMALFNEPDVFQAGAALRSVTDWAHYNHGYTENILNTPVLDSIAYRRSSPIYFAEGLQNNLLMCHGMVDDNVQFQDIIRLSQRLIELGKENWELAVYPLEAHGFKEPSSWTDEYKRILKLFENTLK